MALLAIPLNILGINIWLYFIRSTNLFAYFIHDFSISTNLVYTISTFAGIGVGSSDSGDNGPATSAGVYNPYGVCQDSAGSPYYLVVFI